LAKCLVCGKEFIMDQKYLKEFGYSIARKLLCSWECYYKYVNNPEKYQMFK